MSQSKDREKRWKEFERELKKAIAKDKKMTKRQRREHQAWLDSLPEHDPAPTKNRVTVIFFGAGDSPARRLRRKKAKR